MNISANSLYHFTKKIENIKGIIKSGFHYSTLKEDIPFTGYKNSPYPPETIRYINRSKAVCFCDIPLQLCSEHREQYGSFVIGLSKEWGFENGITPIRYIHNNSPDINHDYYRNMQTFLMMLPLHDNNPFKVYLKFLENTNQVVPPNEEEMENLPMFAKKAIKIMNEQLLQTVKHLRFVQNYLRSYEDNWEDRVTGKITKRTFYDEKEWRAVKGIKKGNNLYFSFGHLSDIIVNTTTEKEDICSFICDEYKVKNVHAVKSKIKLWENIKSL